MGWPTLKVEVAFATDPMDTPTWVDVSSYVRAATITRGKQRVLDDMRAGGATVVLDNSDGRFSPENASGAYSPNVLPGKRMRIIGTWSAVDYGMFDGYVVAWDMQFPAAGKDAVVSMRCVDGFRLLNQQKFTQAYGGAQQAGGRINQVLDQTQWSSSLRDINTASQTETAPFTFTDYNPLQAIHQLTATESGLSFIDVDGNVKFMSRHDLMEETLDTTNHTFGPSDKAYRNPVFSYDDTDVFNDIRLTSDTIAEQTATDATSQTTYGARVFSRTDLLHNNTSEQSDQAAYLLVGFKDPALRVDQIEPLGQRGDIWQRILDRDLGSKIRVKMTPPGGDAIEQDSFIEGVRWQVTPSEWKCMWNLVPTDRRVDFWLLEDAVLGKLGQTTRLGY